MPARRAIGAVTVLILALCSQPATAANVRPLTGGLARSVQATTDPAVTQAFPLPDAVPLNANGQQTNAALFPEEDASGNGPAASCGGGDIADTCRRCGCTGATTAEAPLGLDRNSGNVGYTVPLTPGIESGRTLADDYTLHYNSMITYDGPYGANWSFNKDLRVFRSSGVGWQKTPASGSLFLTTGPQTYTFDEVLVNQTDPHGLGAFSFDLHYDPTVWQQPGIDLSPAAALFAASGRTLNCAPTVPLSGAVDVGCTSTGAFGAGPVWSGPQVMARVTLTPPDTVVQAVRPNKENGVVSTVTDDGVTVTNACGQPLNDGTLVSLPGQPECQGNPLPGVGPGGVLLGSPDGGATAVTARRLEGDVYADCQVDVRDMQVEASKFGLSVGSLSYSVFYDVNEPLQHGDGEIDINDVQFVFGRFGSTCALPLPPQPPPPPAEVTEATGSIFSGLPAGTFPVLPQPGDLVLADGSGRALLYQLQFDGSYRPPAGFYTRLVSNANGTFTLRDRHGATVQFDVHGWSTQIRDRNGNVEQIVRDTGRITQIADPLGRTTSFAYDVNGLLHTVTDFAGRTTTLTHDADGDLTAVTTPAVVGTPNGNDFPAGKTTAFTYSSGFADPRLDHNLLTVTAPDEVAAGGPPRLVNRYDTTPGDYAFDRLVGQTDGGTNASGVPAGGSFTITYTQLNAGVVSSDPNLPRNETRISDRNGNVRRYLHNGLGNELEVDVFTRGVRPGDPPVFTTTHRYNADGELVETTEPAGNSVQYVYDTGAAARFQRGDLLSETRLPGPRGGDQAQIVTTYSYEPVYNGLRTTTEARGNNPGYAPQNGGANAPARYTTTYTFDYEEGCDFAAISANAGLPAATVQALLTAAGMCGAPLGDVNGDSLTTQVAGNAIRTARPTVHLLPGSNEAAVEGTTLQPIVDLAVYNQDGQVTKAVDPEGNVTLYAYYPEDNPDGDGVTITPGVGTGPFGYLKRKTVDAVSAAARDSGTNPPPADLTTQYLYDPVGNVVKETDPRGIATCSAVNQLGEVVRTVRACDVSAALANPQEPQGPSSENGLVAYAYYTDNVYDYNGNVVERDVQNTAFNTPAAVTGSVVRSTSTYDILDNKLTDTQEVSDTPSVVNLTTAYRYDPNENQTQVAKPEGNYATTSYDERDLVLQETRGTGGPFGGAPSTTADSYDGNRNLVALVAPAPNSGAGPPETTLYTYDGYDRQVSSRDPVGGITQQRYDPAGNVVRTQHFGTAGGPSPADNSGAGNVLLSERDASYDELSRQFEADDLLFVSAGVVTQRPPVLTDGPACTPNDGKVCTRTEYDRGSRQTFLVQDDLDTSRTFYDGADRTMRTVDPENNEVATVYDGDSNVTRTVETERTQAGNSPSLTETFTTLSVYDALNRLVRTTDNVGQTRRFQYDSRDNQILVSDAKGCNLITDPLGLYPGLINDPGNTTHTFYDGLNRRISQVQDLRVGGVGCAAIDTSNPANPDGLVVNDWQWDGDSRLVAVADDGSTPGRQNTSIGVIEPANPLGNVTRYRYDNLDRRTRETLDDGTANTYAYDQQDNVVSMTDENGTVRTETYDNLNRLVQVDVARAPGVIGTTQQRFQYDGLSRPTLAFDNNDPADPTTAATATYPYDSLSRLLEEAQNGTPVSSQWRGTDERLALIYPNGRQLKYTNDKLDRTQSIRHQGAGSDLVDYAYIGPGRVLERTYQNGVRLTYLDDARASDIGYDADRRVVRQRHLRADNSVVADFGYSYDREDNKLAEKRSHSGCQDTFTYDSLYRLVTFNRDVNVGGCPSASQMRQYQLDGNGNWASLNGIPNQVNNLNAYEEPQASPAACPTGLDAPPSDFGATNQEFRYDCNGNLVEDQQGTTAGTGNTYQYDFLNRLRRITRKSDGAVIGNYTYDADGCQGGMDGCGRRVTRSFVDATASDSVRYLYDGIHEIEEQSATGTVQQYVVGNRVDEWLTLDQYAPGSSTITQTLFYSEDARTDVAALTDATGACVERYIYDAYGQPLVEDCSSTPIPGVFKSAVGNPHLYTGRRWDSETARPNPNDGLFDGMYYYRARYLRTETGRFVSRDQVATTDPRSAPPSSYVYADGNSPNLADPQGFTSTSTRMQGLVSDLHGLFFRKYKTDHDCGFGMCAALVYGYVWQNSMGKAFVDWSSFATKAGPHAVAFLFPPHELVGELAKEAILDAAKVLQKKLAEGQQELFLLSSRNFDEKKCGCDLKITMSNIGFLVPGYARAAKMREDTPAHSFELDVRGKFMNMNCGTESDSAVTFQPNKQCCEPTTDFHYSAFGLAWGRRPWVFGWQRSGVADISWKEEPR